MHRVGIVTIIDFHNYGNRLQNFALHETLSQMGARALTIRNTPDHQLGIPPVQRLTSSIRYGGLGALAQILRNRTPRRSQGAPLSIPSDALSERAAVLQRFTEQHLTMTDLHLRDQAVRHESLDDFAAFIVGSDQVWNPEYRLANPIDFLRFAPARKRIAYAASFGTDTLPSYVVARYRRWLRGIPAISVREDQGADLVRRLTGRTVPVVLDPTMLLTAEQWEALSRQPELTVDRPYSLRFMLDPARPSMVLNYQTGGDEDGVCLLDLNSPRLRSELSLNPFEFVGLIKGARSVTTDSFHTAVFALLFGVPLRIAGRGRMNGRIESLLRRVGVESPQDLAAGSILRVEGMEPASVEASLSPARAESLAFLRNAIRDAVGAFESHLDDRDSST